MLPETHLMTTEEVARRLGVKPVTVYAYVSRGLLKSHRNADGKGSLFSKDDIDTFQAGRKRTTTPGIQTGITLIRDGELFYRGRDVGVLARTASFEEVATLLWTGDLEHVALTAPDELLTVARAVAAPLPAASRMTDRLRVIVAAASAADPMRFDTSEHAVVATGRALLATMVDALPAPGGVHPVGRQRLATRLWIRLSSRLPGDDEKQLLNAALVLLADHDIAASTFAARVAASTRAHPYAVVSAGLAALDGPLHGAASGLAHALIGEAIDRDDPLGTIADRLRTGAPVPGFGHRLYTDGDPRAATLLELIPGGPARDMTLRLASAMRTRNGQFPNIDLALAALTRHYDMPAEAGEVIFAIARTAGWLAHALEEYADRPSRFRVAGQYSGRQPGN